MVNIFDFIPPAENLEAAYLIVRALIERYLSILLRFYSNLLKFVELLSMMAPS
jgi:hypothetical protein